MARRGRALAEDDDEAAASLTVEPAAAPAAVSLDDAQEANARAVEREWSKQVDRDLQKQFLALEARYSAMLVSDFGEDAAARIMRIMSPILKAGREYGRRERFRPKARPRY